MGNNMTQCYEKIYSEEGSFKEKWDGKIATEYKVPKYIRIFWKAYRNEKPMNVLELGAGNGEVSELILAQCSKFIKSYTVTEISKAGVKRLKQKGFKVHQVDAIDLSRFKDNSFDLVFCIDVMHHVNNPRKMALEMLRVTRKHVFLIEANGICLLRKLMEFTSKYRMAGENSYPPWTYNSFFKSSRLKNFSIRPFLFMVPFTPNFLIKVVILMSETLERIPLFKWQGSGVVICAEKKNL